MKVKAKVINLEKAYKEGKLPKRVGGVNFRFGLNLYPHQTAVLYEDLTTHRETFFLSVENTKFIRLPGKQFLVQEELVKPLVEKELNNNFFNTFWGGYNGKRVFLTEIHQYLFFKCREQGFSAFYNELKPRKLKKLERKFRMKHERMRRGVKI